LLTPFLVFLPDTAKILEKRLLFPLSSICLSAIKAGMKRSAMTVNDIIVRLTLLGRTAPFAGNEGG